MVEGYEAGATLAELASKFGFHRTTVSRSLKKAGLRLRRSGLDEREVLHAIELYEAGMTLAEVGEMLDVAASTVRRALHDQGAVLRPPGMRLTSRVR